MSHRVYAHAIYMWGRQSSEAEENGFFVFANFIYRLLSYSFGELPCFLPSITWLQYNSKPPLTLLECIAYASKAWYHLNGWLVEWMGVWVCVCAGCFITFLCSKPESRVLNLLLTLQKREKQHLLWMYTLYLYILFVYDKSMAWKTTSYQMLT